MGASVSFSFAMVMALEKRDLCVAVNETFKGLDTRSLDDVVGNLPLHVQQQVIVGMLVWITASAVRIEHKVDHLGTLVDGLEEAVEDLAIGVRAIFFVESAYERFDSPHRNGGVQKIGLNAILRNMRQGRRPRRPA